MEHPTFLAASCRALSNWVAANRLACRAESELLRSELQRLRGEGEGPSERLREHVVLLRAQANALRCVTCIDFARDLHVPLRHEGLAHGVAAAPRVQRPGKRITSPAPAVTRNADLIEVT